jgi:hypothetical protein
MFNVHFSSDELKSLHVAIHFEDSVLAHMVNLYSKEDSIDINEIRQLQNKKKITESILSKIDFFLTGQADENFL